MPAKKSTQDRVRKAFAKVADLDPVAATLAQPGAQLKAPRKPRRKGIVRQSMAIARAHEAQVWEMLAQGRTVGYIARTLGLKGNSISHIIRRVERRYEAITVASVGEMKARQARMLEYIADESMEAWRRSQQPATKVVTETGTMAGNKGEMEVNLKKQTVEKQVGDHRFLETARSAMSDLRDVYGLNVPKQLALDPGGLGGNGSFHVEWSTEDPSQPPEPKPAVEVDAVYLPDDASSSPQTSSRTAQRADMSEDQTTDGELDWSDDDETTGGDDETEGGLVE